MAESLGLLILSIRSIPRIAAITCYVALTFIIGYRLFQFL
jgi:hypothetical protein